MKNLFVEVVYRNDRLEPVYSKTYALSEYTEMLKQDLFRILTDVEDQTYVMNDNKPCHEWTDESWARYSRIKHKLLDKAGDIGRLPDTIRIVESKEDTDPLLPETIRL